MRTSTWLACVGAFALFAIRAQAEESIRLSNHQGAFSPAPGVTINTRTDKVITPKGIKTIDYSVGKTSFTRSYARVQTGKDQVIVEWSKGNEPGVYRLGVRDGKRQLDHLIGGSSGKRNGQAAVESLLKKAGKKEGTIITGPDKDSMLVVIPGKKAPSAYYVGTEHNPGPAMGQPKVERLTIWGAPAVTYREDSKRK